MKKKLYKILSVILSLSLILGTPCFAQGLSELNIAGYLGQMRSQLVVDKFRPLHLRYLSYGAEDNTFHLFLDKGDLKNPQTQELEDSSKQLLKYFFVGISIPNDSFWVNLRPDAEDNIIDDYLAKTDIGRIMLEVDLQLKKDTAKATSPQTPEGREYWNKLYQKAEELFGSESITIPTLTRPWIVPDEIVIRETTGSAYVYKATLKVMLEQDYLKNDTVYNFKDDRLKQLNEYSSQLIRELIIPKLTKEVNTSKRYATLRQVYYSLILAQWFKARFSGKGDTYSRIIDRKELTNLVSNEPWSKAAYFQAYQKSFKDGEYNIKEQVYTSTGQVIRSYFSGGIIATSADLDLALRSPIAKAGNVMVQFAATDFDASGSPILAEMVIQADNPGSEVIVRGEGNPSAVNPPAIVEPIALPVEIEMEELLAQRMKAITGDVGVEIMAGSLPIEEEPNEAQLTPNESIVSNLPESGLTGVSSPILHNKNVLDTTGGIDFRILPIVTQAMSNLSLNASRIPLSSLESINLDQELEEINRLVKAGITPSAERIKEYVQASCLKGNFDIQKIVSCIVDILRLEEMRCCSSDATLKDILVVLESVSSAQELKAVFIGNYS
ncbi:MAG: hypothetical protein KKH57_03625 [Candidatus Omnitrophica bacterium]|nr:hypothetical protein [Candidatus Omnitrophota bacterium]